MAVKCRRLPMLAGSIVLAAALSLAAAASAERQTPQPAAKTRTASHRTIHHRRARKPRLRGQKAIDGERVRQIQEALIREHYLKGEPSGKWDESTQLAMHRYQADQGWQSKTVPDSRALIRLGLGPDTGHLLNPESAMTTAVPAVHGASTARKSSSQTAVPAAAMPSNAAQVSAPSAEISVTPSR
jgi:peptidoglycan hydrolase-like protein with peptidoglycan-binding domain